jgi:hypothetical protein
MAQATWEKYATDDASAVPQSHPGFRMYSAAEFKGGYVDQQPYTWYMQDDDRQVEPGYHSNSALLTSGDEGA